MGAPPDARPDAPLDAPGGYAIRAATAGDLGAWLASVADQQRENGRDGVYFSPWSARAPGPPRSRAAVEGYAERLARPVEGALWLRMWLAWEVAPGRVVGHADLAGARLPSEMHRCTLGMGIERAHHRRGLGAALLGAAVAWARAEAGIAWIDLGVFAGNAPARALYHRAGFVETGRTPDRFRVDGVVIDDVQMVLRVKGRQRQAP